MSENFSGITPLNWRALVAEALRRRKAEKLTQRQHAALASVSIPTIVAFDRGERTLSLAKAFDILRVVGLVEEPAEDGAQERFVQEAFARWNQLIAKLAKNSPARFPHGSYRIDYALEGDVKDVELHKLPELLRQIGLRNTGWPMFLPLDRAQLTPYEIDGVLECWLDPRVERYGVDAAHCDFWRASPNAHMFLIRGYQEDSQETFAPGKIFDTTLCIWRLGEALLHAARYAKAVQRDPHAPVTVKFRAHYTGLLGRVLKAWANPLSGLLMEGLAARSDEAILETTVPASEIEVNLADHIIPLVASLYERFGVAELSPNHVRAEIEQFMKKGRD